MSTPTESPLITSDQVPDDIKAFIVQTLADLPEERREEARQYQEEFVQERENGKSDAGPRLPYELIAHIAQLLQDEIDVTGFNFIPRTLAALNRVSKAVHQITLAHLYCRTFYESDYSFAKSVLPKTIPKGWQYVKHMYVNDVTVALVKQYQSFHFPSETDKWRESSLLQLFPRLEILSVATDVEEHQFVETEHAGVRLYHQNLRITLYKPVTVDDVQRLNLQFHGMRNDSCVCFFGAQLATSLDSGWINVSHITHLTICGGAGIVKSNDKDGIVTREQGMQFKPKSDVQLVIQEPADKQLTQSSLSLVLDLFRVAKFSPGGYNTLELQCGSRVLDILNDTLLLGRLPSGDLRIQLEGDLVGVIERHIETIGDTYSQQWTCDRSREEEEPLFSVEGCCHVPAALTRNMGYGDERIRLRTEGALFQDFRNGNGTDGGFYASILTETDFLVCRRYQGSSTYDVVKEYPCRHVPVPADW